ncbi:cytochrome c oxidase subunit II [Paenibacillus aurantius]|uniref:Cytochrome aa3 subunit 2 n=1 Tax=Paenibacillus aurantius TaxID=2918900 RepID=A0AA96LIC4_9BACL|nr:cytochrome c oxidase subunit II [Paenibacillus aurantius]WJH37184.1 cytochrome c oxidase subunit II [Paenibacillus sp. CC-CFT747]WNQ12496.1 cytochrome c oxidase subunit II [Paenibacillus aurantius]
MHIHRLEKIWLAFGMAMLAVFLLVIGVSAFAMGMAPPTSHAHDHKIDPAQVKTTAPFDKPGLRQTGDHEYEAVMTAFTFGYSPNRMEVPAGSTVHFTITSSDVVHGFEIPGTNVNMMILPGEINHATYTFTKPGEYLVLCNEYCGAAHEWMKTVIVVK